MDIFAWVTPAFVKGMPVDHTWVTTYDSRKTSYSTISDVVASGEHYWFSWGSFHAQGNPRDFPSGLILDSTTSHASLCLVSADNPKGRGTIQWYGIHGVCHQVSNQILYPAKKNVCLARGYKLSTSIFGTFGRKEEEWNAQRINCRVAPARTTISSRTGSLLVKRANYLLGIGNETVKILETLRQQTLHDIDDIGYVQKGSEESRETRAATLNARIQRFLNESADALGENLEVYERLFGVRAGEIVNLIDPELFEFPDPETR